MQMDTIPREIVAMMLEYFKTRDKLLLRLVCKQFKSICEKDRNVEYLINNWYKCKLFDIPEDIKYVGRLAVHMRWSTVDRSDIDKRFPENNLINICTGDVRWQRPRQDHALIPQIRVSTKMCRPYVHLRTSKNGFPQTVEFDDETVILLKRFLPKRFRGNEDIICRNIEHASDIVMERFTEEAYKDGYRYVDLAVIMYVYSSTNLFRDMCVEGNERQIFSRNLSTARAAIETTLFFETMLKIQNKYKDCDFHKRTKVYHKLRCYMNEGPEEHNTKKNLCNENEAIDILFRIVDMIDEPEKEPELRVSCKPKAFVENIEIDICKLILFVNDWEGAYKESEMKTIKRKLQIRGRTRKHSVYKILSKIEEEGDARGYNIRLLMNDIRVRDDLTKTVARLKRSF